MGAELLGDASPEADAEMIAMLVESLLNSGLREFQVKKFVQLFGRCRPDLTAEDIKKLKSRCLDMIQRDLNERENDNS